MVAEELVKTLYSVHDGQTHIGEYLSGLFQGLPIGVAWKDVNSIGQGCNKFFADLLDLSDPQEIIGKTDYSFLPEEDAQNFIKDDQDVILNERPRFNDIREAHFVRTYVVQSTTKIPVISNIGEILGVVGFGYILSMTKVSTSQRIQNLLNLCYSNYLCNLDGTTNYYVVSNDKNIKLTLKQAECLTHLAMGKTVKQIAKTFECSQSTVLTHVKVLKRKLGVFSTSALIDCFWKNPIHWF